MRARGKLTGGCGAAGVGSIGQVLDEDMEVLGERECGVL